MSVSQMLGNRFLDPQSILDQCEINEAAVAADFGCGPGFFSLPLAEIVGKYGKVHAFDVLPQALESIESRARIAGLENIETRRANLEKVRATKLADCSVDFVVLKDMLFQNQKKQEIIEEAFRVLKHGGKAVIVEWNEHDYTIGPEKEVRIKQDQLKEILSKVGFQIETPIEAGKFHYALLIVKS